MNDEPEWDGVIERREPCDDEVLHVTVDRLSQAVEGRIGRLEGRFDKAIDVGLKVLYGIFGLVGFLVVAGASVGGWVVFRENEIEARPTRAAVEQMIEQTTQEKTEALSAQIATLRAEGRVTRELTTEGFTNMGLTVEALKEQATALRRDFEREHGGQP